MEVDSASAASFLEPRRVAEKDAKTSLSVAPSRNSDTLPSKMQNDASATPRAAGHASYQSSVTHDAPGLRVNRPSSGGFGGRDSTSRRSGADDIHPSSGHSASSFSLRPDNSNIRLDRSFQRQPPPPPPPPPPSSSNSQATNSTHDGGRVFTPPTSEGEMSARSGNGHDSSQESQLLQLSHLAAAQEKIIPSADTSADGLGASSRKRMADGMVKDRDTRERSSASPVRMGGHSRNPSAVSVASTTGSRIGELSAELKARLSYAMVKVNHGWQSHSIDTVESLASQAASPTSSTSTIHLRNGSSASPQLSNSSLRASNNTTPSAAALHHHFPAQLPESWRDSHQARPHEGPTSPVKMGATATLAPPVSIQPSRQIGNPRRNSFPRQTPTFLSHPNQASPNAGPHTPGQPSPYLGTPHQRTPLVDPIIFSPHQNVREQDAIESLLFMSSPGNSANLKHTFPPSSSQPLPSSTRGSSSLSQRTALPNAPPRKSLPTGRPSGHSLSQPQQQQQQQQPQQKRVGFEKSPSYHGSEMDVDDPPPSGGTPHARGTPRRKLVNGSSVGSRPGAGSGGHGGHGEQAHGQPGAAAAAVVLAPRLKQLPVSAGLTAPARPRRVLADEDIDRMLDRAANDSSDSDGEIHIPVRRIRRDGTRPMGAA